MVSDRRLLIRTPLINVITRSLYASIKYFGRDFREIDSLLNTQNGPLQFANSCRDRIQDILVEELMQARPRFGLKVADEAVTIGADEDQFWVIDPLCGMQNFTHGVPAVAISVGLEFQGNIIAGATYDPLHDEMFYAEKGQGAFVNDRRLTLSQNTDLKNAIIGLSPFESSSDPKQYLVNLGRLKGRVKGLHISGCLALDCAYLAAGRYNALYVDSDDLCDVAAGNIILREAKAVQGGHQPENPLVSKGFWGNHMIIKQVLGLCTAS